MERSQTLTLVARPLGTTRRNHEQIERCGHGDVAVISGVEGDARFVGRVTSIGLTVGCEVQVLQNVRKRPVLVYGRDSVIAVDAEDCARIDVQVRS